VDWDWDNTLRNRDLRPQPIPVLELFEEHWRVMAPTGRVVTCAAYRLDGPGVELRAGYSQDEVPPQPAVDGPYTRACCRRNVAGLNNPEGTHGTADQQTARTVLNALV
jgi:hypothetical protein